VQDTRNRSSRLICAALAFFAVSFLIGGCRRKPSTQFEQENAAGVAHNPPGLELSLRTQARRTKFHLYERIPLEISFSSSRPLTYSIELDEQWNAGGANSWFYVDPQEAVLRTGAMWGTRAFICCDSQRPFLTGQATVLRRDLTDFVRFEQPGQYEIFLAARRAFFGKGGDSDDTFVKFSDFKLTSNILTMTILRDDPVWDSARLAAAIGKLDDPQSIVEYQRELSMARERDQVTSSSAATADLLNRAAYAEAQSDLNMLDTREAIQERVNRIRPVSPEPPGDHNGAPHEVFWSPTLGSTTRPDLVVDAFAPKAADAAFAVDYNFADHWAYVPRAARPSGDLSYGSGQSRRIPRVSIVLSV
jgi:hypothetical protein